jgi:hypothetical protein
VLTNKLCDVFEAKADYANAMQDRYVVALKAFVIFLDRSGVAQPAPARLALDARDGVSSALPCGAGIGSAARSSSSARPPSLIVRRGYGLFDAAGKRCP